MSFSISDEAKLDIEIKYSTFNKVPPLNYISNKYDINKEKQELIHFLWHNFVEFDINKQYTPKEIYDKNFLFKKYISLIKNSEDSHFFNLRNIFSNLNISSSLKNDFIDLSIFNLEINNNTISQLNLFFINYKNVKLSVEQIEKIKSLDINAIISLNINLKNSNSNFLKNYLNSLCDDFSEPCNLQYFYDLLLFVDHIKLNTYYKETLYDELYFDDNKDIKLSTVLNNFISLMTENLIKSNLTLDLFDKNPSLFINHIGLLSNISEDRIYKIIEDNIDAETLCVALKIGEDKNTCVLSQDLSRKILEKYSHNSKLFIFSGVSLINSLDKQSYPLIKQICATDNSPYNIFSLSKHWSDPYVWLDFINIDLNSIDLNTIRQNSYKLPVINKQRFVDENFLYYLKNNELDTIHKLFVSNPDFIHSFFFCVPELIDIENCPHTIFDMQIGNYNQLKILYQTPDNQILFNVLNNLIDDSCLYLIPPSKLMIQVIIMTGFFHKYQQKFNSIHNDIGTIFKEYPLINSRLKEFYTYNMNKFIRENLWIKNLDIGQKYREKKLNFQMDEKTYTHNRKIKL